MPLQNRETLKTYFKKGQMPAEGHFTDLIDSLINKVDDGMSKTMDDGLMLSPIGTSQKLMSFFKSIEDKSPAWRLEVDASNSNLNINNHLDEPVLTLNTEGKIGVNNSSPKFEMDVNGVVAMNGRTGNAHKGKVKADGKWHPVISNLTACHAFEIIAGIGKKKTGKYALLHSIAISTFGKSKNKIKTIQAFYGTRGNKIELRWTGKTYDYNLEMRTRSNYGGDIFVQFNISNLWHDQFMDSCINISE